MFVRYSLRTTDVDAARRFYAEALDLQLPSGSSPDTALELYPLHDRARAAGAPPHWLGHLAVEDVEASAALLLNGGGERLGPTVTDPDGATFAVLRDPFGSVVSVRQNDQGTPNDRVVWHQLHTRDAERAWRTYSMQFRWRETSTVQVDGLDGGLQLFSWGRNGDVGMIGNTARWPGVHPNWLFHFAVEDLEAATARVVDAGGVAFPTATLPDGRRLVACDDPQGAAFGLFEGT